MLADPGLVIVQPIEMDEQLHVAIDREQRVFAQRMKRREKDAGLEISVVHGLGLGCLGDPMVARTDRLDHEPLAARRAAITSPAIARSRDPSRRWCRR